MAHLIDKQINKNNFVICGPGDNKKSKVNCDELNMPHPLPSFVRVRKDFTDCYREKAINNHGAVNTVPFQRRAKEKSSWPVGQERISGGVSAIRRD